MDTHCEEYFKISLPECKAKIIQKIKLSEQLKLYDYIYILIFFKILQSMIKIL